MEAKPVRKYAPPAYPTRRTLLSRPLDAHLAFGAPWPLRPTTAAAVGLLLAGGLAGCAERAVTKVPESVRPPDATVPPTGRATEPAATDTPSASHTPVPPTTTPAATPACVKLARTIVAPLFVHGEGRGATGCMIMVPPVFLSEEEALLVIREELALHGIWLGRGGRKLGDIQVAPRVHWRIHKEDGEDGFSWDAAGDLGAIPDRTRAAALELDGEDGRGVAVEFVSAANYHQLGGTGSMVQYVDEQGQPTNFRSMSSVEDYDFREVAEYVASEARCQGLTPTRLGIFYDPVTQEDLPEAEARERSRGLLRQQARDFARWLREQDAG